MKRHNPVVDAISCLVFIVVSHGFVVPYSGRPPTNAALSLSVPSTEALVDNDDASLLDDVDRAVLVSWCDRLNLKCEDRETKQDLLNKLRSHASQQINSEKQRLHERVKKIEEGSDDPREKYEFLPRGCEDVDDEDDEDPVFYFPLLEGELSLDRNATSNARVNNTQQERPITSSVISAPPPPKDDSNGERVVTVYSTTDHNDLTGVAAAQPGQQMDSLLSTPSGDSMSGSNDQTWDPASTSSSGPSQVDLDQATEQVTELVQNLLASTGAPTYNSEENEQLAMLAQQPSSKEPSFDPARIPADWLAKADGALRTGNVLQDVLRQFELQAIGYDGNAGDDVDNGGGRYRMVASVRAFLQGYCLTQQRKMARQTIVMLLDTLVQQGLSGLDATLGAMTRGGNQVGDLNDGLIEFLNDMVRQQQRRTADTVPWPQMTTVEHTDKLDDQIEALWNVTTDEDGRRIATIDPSDRDVQKLLKDEQAMNDVSIAPNGPKSGSERLLLLLTLLRERIKTEAAVIPDERGRNLRLLAYCLRLRSVEEREQYIRDDIGVSADRLDSFRELLVSSIEYSESASYQLKPASQITLDARQLKSILLIVEELRLHPPSRPLRVTP